MYTCPGIEYLAAIGLFGEDERFSAYLTGSNMIGETIPMGMTFRWDFLIYSAMEYLLGVILFFAVTSVTNIITGYTIPFSSLMPLGYWLFILFIVTVLPR